MLRRSAYCALIVVCTAVACGKSGPPLPPLVHVPIAPTSLTAERRGDVVDLQFVVPDANTDRTRPANIASVDVYAITDGTSLTDEQLLKRGTKVASVAVKAPKDPNETVEEDEPTEDVEAAVGAGLDQGAVAHVSETLTAAAKVPADAPREKRRSTSAAGGAGPLLGPAPRLPARTYAAVGVSTRGKRGPLSKRAMAPLIDPPPAPAAPKISYTESEVTIAWRPVSTAATAAAGDVLPSHPIGLSAPTIGYNVYEGETKITKTPTAETKVTDPRITWGERRCYSVRAATTIGDATVESRASPEACETLVDTFPPAAPKSLNAVAGERSISLIWDANTEKDLAGYLVFRGREGGPLEPITPAPIQETTFTDAVDPGVRFTYAVQAVDRAGNASDFSARVEEVAR